MATPHLVVFGIVTVIGLHAQPVAPNSDAKFEVASLKPSLGGSPSTGPSPGGGGYRAHGVTLKVMISAVYRVKTTQVIGGPDWIGRDRFDLDGKAERPSSVEELRIMVRNLLAERFQLQFRKETRELPVYVLTVDKGGAKLIPHEPESVGDARVEVGSSEPLHIRMKGISASIENLVWQLGYLLDPPIIDRTGLQGGYDFDLAFTLEPPASMTKDVVAHNGRPIDFSGPTVVQALRQQLGLRLEAGKGPAEIFVINRVEKLLEN